MKQLFINAHLVSPGWEAENGALLVSDGRIETVFAEMPQDLPAADEVFDFGGELLLPGFFDIHFHGCEGSDFCDATEEAVRTVVRGKLRQGVTSILGTTLTLDESVLARSIEAGRACANVEDGAEILGIHLEGPFIAPEFAGAQNPAFLKKPDLALVDRLNDIFPVKKVSYSPELDEDFSFLGGLVERGIMPSAAHTGADYELFMAAADRGLLHLTHFCNCMTPLHHLRPGMVGGCMFRKDTMPEMICDGVHLRPEIVKFLFEVIGPERIMLITDSMCAAGLDDGEYSLGGLPVVVRDGCARLTTGAVAGSTLVFDQGVRNVCKWTGLPLKEIVRTTAYNQARSLGFTDIGKLEAGFRANFVKLSRELYPQAAWIGGQMKWSV